MGFESRLVVTWNCSQTFRAWSEDGGWFTEVEVFTSDASDRLDAEAAAQRWLAEERRRRSLEED